MTHCPHCGAKLPPVVDAFCPDCRSDLNEPKSDGAGHDQAIADPNTPSTSDPSAESNGASEFGLRLLAYFIDILPITIIVTITLAAVFDLDAVPNRILGRADEERLEFIRQRLIIRDVSLLVYLGYSILMDASALRGTLGKMAVGLIVTDEAGRRIGIGKSIGRNLSKLVSFAACGLGCLWIIWSKDHRAWHDIMSGTRVDPRDGLASGD